MSAQAARLTTLGYQTSSILVPLAQIISVNTNFSRDSIDTTHLGTSGLMRTSIPSWGSSEWSATIRFSASDTELFTLFDDAVVCDWAVCYGNNNWEAVGDGYITSLDISADVDGLVEASITIQMTGTIAEDATPS